MLKLPNDIINRIDLYLGSERYWNARKQLTIINAKLDLFSCAQWESLHDQFKWYHWRKLHPCCTKTHILKYNTWSKISSYLPLRCKWLLKQEKDVYLLIRMFKNSIHEQGMLSIANKSLEQLVESCTSYASYYRQIVFD